MSLQPLHFFFLFYLIMARRDMNLKYTHLDTQDVLLIQAVPRHLLKLCFINTALIFLELSSLKQLNIELFAQSIIH